MLCCLKFTCGKPCNPVIVNKTSTTWGQWWYLFYALFHSMVPSMLRGLRLILKYLWEVPISRVWMLNICNPKHQSGWQNKGWRAYWFADSPFGAVDWKSHLFPYHSPTKSPWPSMEAWRQQGKGMVNSDWDVWMNVWKSLVFFGSRL